MDKIFVKIKKNIFELFFFLFAQFGPNESFPKKSFSVTFLPLWTPNLTQVDAKKSQTAYEPIPVTDGRTDGRADGGKFIGPISASGGPKIDQINK